MRLISIGIQLFPTLSLKKEEEIILSVLAHARATEVFVAENIS
jgi:hypothetical protein